jgi:hypothetical protein
MKADASRVAPTPNRSIGSLLSWVDPYVILLLTLSLLALTPLSAPGYFFASHDGRHSVFYLNMFDASIRDGAWWPRWAMHHNQGYGYPTFIIQAPLGFYLAEIFILLGAGYTLAAKLAWTTGFLCSGWGMYTLVVHWLRAQQPSQLRSPRPQTMSVDPLRLAGLAAGLLYVFFPYHLVGLYVRAALNDTLLLTWFPWVILAFDHLIEQGAGVRWQQRLALAVFSLVSLLLTHTFALISFAPLLVAYVLFRLVATWRPNERAWVGLIQRMLLALAAGLGALLVCAAFLIPLFVEGRALQQQVFVSNTYDFRRHFVYWGQYLSPVWGFGYSDDPTGANDGMSFQVGLLVLLVAGSALGLVWRRSAVRGLALYLLGSSVALLWLMSPAAIPLWETIPPLGVVQFPWRLLALTGFSLCALAGLAVGYWAAEQAEQPSTLLALGLVVLLGSAAYIGAPLQPVEPWREDGRAVFQFEQEHPDMLGYTAWVQEPFQSSPMSKDYADAGYEEPHGVNQSLERLAILQGAGRVVRQESRGSSFGGVVQLDQPAVVRIHLYYFPGWQVTVDGVVVHHRPSGPQGLIEVDVPAGEHHLMARMGPTPPRRWGAAISWLTILLLLGLVAWSQLRQDGRRG